jgi:hypothetical protein
MANLRSFTVELDDEDGRDIPFRLGNSPFTAVVTENMAKIRSPVTGIKILLTHDTLGQVEIGWRFTKHKPNGDAEIELKGRRCEARAEMLNYDSDFKVCSFLFYLFF